jgi:hypothetical protein
VLLFTTKIRPEYENNPRPARAYGALRTRPPFGLKRKSAHRPARAQRAPCSRPPFGPKPKPARCPTHARHVLRFRPQPGPGPGKSFPTWAATRSGDHEPSICIQRPREESGQTKPRRRPRANPSVHSVSPLPLPHRSEQPTEFIG